MVFFCGLGCHRWWNRNRDQILFCIVIEKQEIEGTRLVSGRRRQGMSWRSRWAEYHYKQQQFFRRWQKRWQVEGTVSEMGLNDIRIEIVGGVYELNELKNNQRGAAALFNSIISNLDLWLLCTFYHLKKVIIMTKCRSPFQMKYLLISQQYSLNLRQAALDSRSKQLAGNTRDHPQVIYNPNT